jgi:2-polyprenyl-3-methyl-5-hydroxy-6-metoxy-1,4-benzoquinol methylase
MSNRQASHRARLYSDYAARVQGSADAFDLRAAERWGRSYWRRIRDWMPADRAADILDVACGSGRLLHLLQQRGYSSVTGVDAGADQVALARQVSARVVQADALDFLASRTGSYDVILGLDIIEHFSKPQALDFLDACGNALKPDGQLVLQTPNGESPWCGAVRDGDLTHETCFTPASLLAMLQLCNFDRVECRECGPVVHGPVSAARALAWKAVRIACITRTAIETGTGGSGVWTRVFLASARKKP